jgi:signal transduction histidine kinase
MMPVTVVVVWGLALVFQCASAVLAVRLIKITNRYGAWILITFSTLLAIPGRAIPFARVLAGALGHPTGPADLLDAVLPLAVSVAQAVGIWLIGPLFESINQSREELRRTNVKIEQKVKERTLELVAEHKRLKELEGYRDTLTHMMVHDLRTPLTSVYGFLETISTWEREKLTEDGRKSLDTAIEQTLSLADMVTSLLDVSKLESGRMELDVTNWDIVAAARRLIQDMEPLREGRTLKISAPEALWIDADSHLIQRVIQNLLGNAYKFTENYARIVVKIESRNGNAKVSVEDNGPGIPSQHRARIFDKFGQVGAHPHLRGYSTGLGLTFCRLAVEAHGGRIWVDSEVGHGSTFHFEIPVTRTDIQPPDPEA